MCGAMRIGKTAMMDAWMLGLLCRKRSSDMSIDIRLNELLGIRHPILLAPMDVISGARLTAAHPQAIAARENATRAVARDGADTARIEREA